MKLLRRALRIYSETGRSQLAKHAWAFLRGRFYKTIGDSPYRYLHKIKYGKHAPKTYDVIHIDPSNVDHIISRRFLHSYSPYASHVVGGDWDINRIDKTIRYAGSWEDITNRGLVSFDDYQFYTSAKRHFLHDVPWEETEIYKWFIKTAEDRPFSLNYSSKSEIKSRLREFDQLYERIKKDGYKSQRDIQSSDNEFPFNDQNEREAYGEVWVNIGRNGSVIFEEGRHRMIIAKLLNVNTIPVRVFVRHRRWQAKRMNPQEETDIPQDHPDLNWC